MGIVSIGNIKTGLILNISLPPGPSGGTCPPLCERACWPVCYANKSYGMYPIVKNAWDLNLKLYKQAPDLYFNFIRAGLSHPRIKNPWFRFHVGGDIPDQAYLDGMINTACRLPGIAFMVFTKRYMLDYRRAPVNLRIFFSVWPGIKKPRFKKGIMGFSYLATDSRGPLTGFKCNDQCDTCGFCYMAVNRVGGPLNVILPLH